MTTVSLGLWVLRPEIGGWEAFLEVSEAARLTVMIDEDDADSGREL